jgi:hypothetical protein
MKKLLVMFAIAGSLVACNNSSETTPSADSPRVDSPAVVVPVAPDTTVLKVDTTTVKVDTSVKK